MYVLIHLTRLEYYFCRAVLEYAIKSEKKSILNYNMDA